MSRMTTKKALCILLFGACFLIVPGVVRAAILPDCDKTIYLVQRDGADACDTDKARYNNCDPITPEEYDARKADWKASHPPIVTSTEKCGFNHFVQLFINLASWGLGSLAALGVLAMVWGGFTLLISAGKQERVQQGKKTIWGAFLGTTIVLSAWFMIGFVVMGLTGNMGNNKFFIFVGTPWERTFSGSGQCPSTYKKSCSIENLSIQCMDSSNNQNGVSNAQQILTNLSCYHMKVDGCFGNGTKQAVVDFQRANQGCCITFDSGTFTMPDYRIGPPTQPKDPDGIIGPTTWAFLRGVSEGVQMKCPCLVTTTPENVHSCL
jgi:hypothetical protein